MSRDLAKFGLRAVGYGVLWIAALAVGAVMSFVGFTDVGGEAGWAAVGRAIVGVLGTLIVAAVTLNVGLAMVFIEDSLRSSADHGMTEG